MINLFEKKLEILTVFLIAFASAVAAFSRSFFLVKRTIEDIWK